MKCEGGLVVPAVMSGFCTLAYKQDARLRSVAILRFELVPRRLAGYAVAVEVERLPEWPEVNGDLRTTVLHRSIAVTQVKRLYKASTK